MGAEVEILVAVACLSTLTWLFRDYIVRVHEARRWLSSGAHLVDVDGPFEFYRHHPRTAVNIPLEELQERVAEVGPKDRAVVVFAHSWRRGAKAVTSLREMGFSMVISAAGLQTKEILVGLQRKSSDARRRGPDLVTLARVRSSDLRSRSART